MFYFPRCSYGHYITVCHRRGCGILSDPSTLCKGLVFPNMWMSQWIRCILLFDAALQGLCLFSVLHLLLDNSMNLVLWCWLCVGGVSPAITFCCSFILWIAVVFQTLYMYYNNLVNKAILNFVCILFRLDIRQSCVLIFLSLFNHLILNRTKLFPGPPLTYRILSLLCWLNPNVEVYCHTAIHGRPWPRQPCRSTPTPWTQVFLEWMSWTGRWTHRAVYTAPGYSAQSGVYLPWPSL